MSVAADSRVPKLFHIEASSAISVSVCRREHYMCIESVAANGLEHSKVLLLPILLITIEHLSYLDGEKRLLRVHGSLLI